jgi:uroporphyrinogen decarboxylase
MRDESKFGSAFVKKWKSTMDKIKRVDNVLDNIGVDRPPVSLWYHFGIQHAGGEQFARITLEYFNTYDFDFLKVMNDYFFLIPGKVSNATWPEKI